MRAMLLVAGLALTSCNRDADVSMTNASPEDVAREISEAAPDGGTASFRPGQWSSEVKLVSFDAPGMPAGVAEQMKSTFAQVTPTASCLTADQAGRPAGDFFTGGKAQGCTYERFEMSGGKIESVLVCGGQGVRQRMEMQGTYSPESFAMTMTSRTALPQAAEGPDNVSMTMQINARRTGECSGAARPA